jgi:serine/threonine protein kinase
MDSYLGKGSYNLVYKRKDLLSNIDYAYRISKFKLNKIEFLINNYIETFIHAFFTIYQKKYLLNNKINVNNNWGIKNILKLRYLGFDATNNCINTILDLMDGTLFDILHIKKIPFDIKIKILLKAVVQITCLIEDLQTNFKFVHNDLKSNNIFYKILDITKSDKYLPDNINFFIGDFGSVRFELNGKLIVGNKDLAKDTSFNSRKDLLLLINSLYFSFNDNLWKDNFFIKFKLDDTIANNTDNLEKLYYLDKKDIDSLYHPLNLKTFLNREFKVPINCRSELGQNEDTILTVFSSKYKIIYN